MNNNKKATVWLFLIVKEPKQGVSSVKLCFAHETTMRREWAMKIPPPQPKSIVVVNTMAIGFFLSNP